MKVVVLGAFHLRRTPPILVRRTVLATDVEDRRANSSRLPFSSCFPDVVRYADAQAAAKRLIVERNAVTGAVARAIPKHEKLLV